MHFRFPIFFLVFATGLLVLPYIAHAGGIPFFGPIIEESWNSCPLSWGALITVINNIISLVITIAIVFVAPIMIAYAGFLYVVNPMSPSGISKAKGILWNTVIGIVIALSAWLIVDAIMAVLYKANAPVPGTTTTLGVWSSLITSGGIPSCLDQAGALPGDTLNQAVTPGIETVTTRAVGNEQAIRQQLANAGITINNAPCPVMSNGSGCTNVSGMRPTTVAQIIAIKNGCGSSCTVQVTGGTEPGHAAGLESHSTGYKVDLALDTVLNTYLESITTPIGVRTGDSSGPAYTDRCISSGNQYVKESDHWGITIFSTCIPPK